MGTGLPVNPILSSESGLSSPSKLKSGIPTLDKNKPDDIKIKKQTLKNSPTQKARNKVAAAKKNKLKMTPCGCCGRFHFPRQCRGREHPKWKNFQCTTRNGYGHPPS